jgi:hypothetical protein
MRSEVAAALRARIAADAVGNTARGAELSEWRLNDDSCSRPVATSPAALRGTRIAFDSADPTARAIAERLVALANQPESPLAAIAPSELLAARGRVTVAGLGQGAFSTALTQGAELAYVISVPRHPGSPCSAYGESVARAGWLADVSSIVPLIDFRPYVIARRDRIALFVDADGTYRLGSAVPSGATRP